MFRYTDLWAPKNFSSWCLLCWIGLHPFFISHMFIATLTATATRQHVEENGNSKAVYPVARHSHPVWTLQPHTWDIQNQLSGKQEGSAVYCSSLSSPLSGLSHPTALSFLLMKVVTLHRTQGIVSRHDGSDPHTECSFVKAQTKKELKFLSALKLLLHLYCSNLTSKWQSCGYFATVISESANCNLCTTYGNWVQRSFEHQKPQLTVLFQGLPVWSGLNIKNPQAGCHGTKSM